MKIYKNLFLNKKIFSIFSNHNNLFIALNNKLCIYDTKKNSLKCLWSFKKSVRSISSYHKGNFLIVSGVSYDGTGVLLDKDLKLIDTIEGPETEIKNVNFFTFDHSEIYISLSTRGKTVWILKNNCNNLERFEIFKILDDHTQDVKGTYFHNDKLYTFSYDKTIQVYESQELYLVKVIKTSETVWNVIIIDERIFVMLQNGKIEVYDLNTYNLIKEIKISFLPLIASCKFNKEIALISNRNILVFFNTTDLRIIKEIELETKGNILSIFYNEEKIYIGSDLGEFIIIELNTL